MKNLEIPNMAKNRLLLLVR